MQEALDTLSLSNSSFSYEAVTRRPWASATGRLPGTGMGSSSSAWSEHDLDMIEDGPVGDLQGPVKDSTGDHPLTRRAPEPDRFDVLEPIVCR